MKSLFIIFAACFLMLILPYLFNSIDDARTESYLQTVSGIDTAAGVYSANVTLGQSVYENTVTSVTGISSNNTFDAPTPASYNSTSKVINVTGLEQDTVRALTFTYLINNSTLPTGGSGILTTLYWFTIFILVGMSGGAIYAFFRT